MNLHLYDRLKNKCFIDISRKDEFIRYNFKKNSNTDVLHTVHYKYVHRFYNRNVVKSTILDYGTSFDVKKIEKKIHWIKTQFNGF